MPDTNNDNPVADDGTQEPEAPAAADAQATAPQGGDEVSVWKSRYSGQTAKVTELTTANTTLSKQLQDALARAEAAEKGVADKDEVAKSLLEAKEQEIAGMRRANELAVIEARFPEVFAEMGEAALGLTPERLASMEARLSVAGVETTEPPTPRGQNAARKDGVPATGREPKEQTSEDILAQLRSMPVPAEWGGLA